METTTERSEGSLGPVIGTIIILLVIILGGLYFWSERTKMADNKEAATAETTDSEAQAIRSQSSSDDAAAIQADLDATNFDSLDSDL